MCPVSKPYEIFAEIARLLKPGAMFAVAFSNRTFPTKSVSIWRSSSVAERSDLIQTYMNSTGWFGSIQFEDLSAAPGVSDSIYAISARRCPHYNLLSRTKVSQLHRRLFLSYVGTVLGMVLLPAKNVAALSIEDRVKKIVVEQLGVRESEVTCTASFVDDLGADSLDTVELVMALEEEFEIEIPDDRAERITTVGQAIGYVSFHLRDSSRFDCR